MELYCSRHWVTGHVRVAEVVAGFENLGDGFPDNLNGIAQNENQWSQMHR